MGPAVRSSPFDEPDTAESSDSFQPPELMLPQYRGRSEHPGTVWAARCTSQRLAAGVYWPSSMCKLPLGVAQTSSESSASVPQRGYMKGHSLMPAMRSSLSSLSPAGGVPGPRMPSLGSFHSPQMLTEQAQRSRLTEGEQPASCPNLRAGKAPDYCCASLRASSWGRVDGCWPVS